MKLWCLEGWSLCVIISFQSAAGCLLSSVHPAVHFSYRQSLTLKACILFLPHRIQLSGLPGRILKNQNLQFPKCHFSFRLICTFFPYFAISEIGIYLKVDKIFSFIYLFIDQPAGTYSNCLQIFKIGPAIFIQLELCSLSDYTFEF